MSKSLLFSVCEIRPNFYITGSLALKPYKTKIKELGFTHAVDVTNNSAIDHHPDVEFFDVKVNDKEDQNISQFFDSAIAFIKKAKESGGKILVFCQAGASRSATICLMYLMMGENLSLRDAFIELDKARPLISPNIGFWRQMIQYEMEKRGKTSVNLVKNGDQEVPDIYWHPLVRRMQKPSNVS